MAKNSKALIVLPVFITLFLLSLTACSMGPKVLKGNRLDYNISLQRSNSEELLLNIVRARYAEQPFFLQVGAISSSFGYSASVGAGATIYERGGAPYGNILMPNLGAGISENPTITYSPIQGEKAVTQLQSELRLDRFLILTRIGWGIESLMWLTVAQIGELRNFDVPLGGGESLDRSYGKFLELSQLLKEIQSRGDLEFVSLYKGKDGADYLTMKLHLLDEREATRVETLLGITPQRVSLPGGRFVSSIELTSVRDLTPCASEKGNCARIPIKLKSFFEMLLDLALYVDVPAEEQLKQIARPFIKPSAGEITTRKGLHSGLIKVRHQWTEPGDAYVAVPYRGRWFYIADDDLPSKAYLMLAGSIFSLQSGDLQTAAPVLTLPVGR